MSRATSIRIASLVLALGAIAGISHSQQVLSAQSGTVHYTEGTVYLDGRELNLGNGLPLFKDLAKPLRVDLAEAKTFPDGTAIHVYQPVATTG